ncbi:PAS domain-containing protein [Xanthomonas sp. Kuri4-1]
MGALMRAHDWAATPMGPPETWPQSFRTSLSIMLNSTLLGAVLWGPELRLFYNDVYKRSLADRHPGALGQPVAQVWGETWAPVSEDFLRVMATGEGFGQGVIELPMFRNGYYQATYWNATASPIKGEDGTVLGLFNMAIETTAQVAADLERDIRHHQLQSSNVGLREEVHTRTAERDRAIENETNALRNAERVQLALAAGAIIGTWNWDVPSDAFMVDNAFAHHFGLNPSFGLTGLTFEQIIETVHPEDREGLCQAIQEVFERGGRYAHQYRVRRHNGHYYWVEANGRVDLDENGKPLRFPGVLLDVEDRRALSAERDRALTELRELNETLEQRVLDRTQALMQVEEALLHSQKMEAVGQLTGGLAHDFNNLLASTSSALEMLSLRIEQGRFNDLPRYIAIAEQACSSAAALTHRLLAFASRQTLVPQATNLNELIAGMLDLIRLTVGPGVRVESALASESWATWVDVSQLESALVNLCINARDAMPSGGRLTIATCNCVIDRVRADALDLPAGDYVTMQVSDTGTGMDDATLARAFEPFFTTKQLGGGTGLGLSMIYGFAKQSSGHVQIASRWGDGSTVTLYLPRHAQASPTLPATDVPRVLGAGACAQALDSNATEAAAPPADLVASIAVAS